MVKKNLAVDALRIKYNDVVFYVAVIDSKKLFSISKVSRAEENPEDGYQRVLGKARAKKIADYIREGNVIPGALVLSAQEGSVRRYDANKKKLFLSNCNGQVILAADLEDFQ
jgi:DGQHR domain-containing protein